VVSKIVTAIVIPIIILYFYLLSRKEKKKKLAKWLEVGSYPEEMKLEGKVTSILTELEQYYHGKYVWKCQLKVKTNSGTLASIVYKKPYVDTFQPLELQRGNIVSCSGIWRSGSFCANEIEIQKMRTS
jgi:hypothetical protein